jgi:hypothetical protein
VSEWASERVGMWVGGRAGRCWGTTQLTSRASLSYDVPERVTTGSTMISPVSGHIAHRGGSNRDTRTGSGIARGTTDIAAAAAAVAAMRIALALALAAAASADLRRERAAARSPLLSSSSSFSSLFSRAERDLLHRGVRFLGATLDAVGVIFPSLPGVEGDESLPEVSRARVCVCVCVRVCVCACACVLP